LKKERIKKQIYKNRELAIADVADYIDIFSTIAQDATAILAGSVPNSVRRPTSPAENVCH
jgi:hypothetical protein